MQSSIFQKITLGLAGISATAIGLFISLSPRAFYASYDIVLDQGPNLLSELRAPGTNLAVLGMVMLAGLFVQRVRRLSVILAILVFSSFALGRIIGITIDGIPSSTIITALIIEVVIAALLAAAFKGDLTPLKRLAGEAIAKDIMT